MPRQAGGGFVITRVDRGRNHWYIDTDTDQRVPGVTSFTSDGLPKPALINWAGSATAEYAVDHWDELAELTPSVRLKTLQGARYASRDAAANKGTQVHKLAEKLVQGDRVTVPDELAGYVESYVRFLDEYDVRPVLVERTVYSAQHHYCGTFDLIAELLDPDDPEPDPEQRQRQTWLLDVKTSRSGIFGETALQLAAYRFAEVWIDEDGAQFEMPEVDLCGGVHVRADGYDLIPLEVEPLQHRQFLYVQQVAQFMAGARELVGEPVASPHASTYRLIREDS
jgi:hypothetical protein